MLRRGVFTASRAVFRPLPAQNRAWSPPAQILSLRHFWQHGKTLSGEHARKSCRHLICAVSVSAAVVATTVATATVKCEEDAMVAVAAEGQGGKTGVDVHANPLWPAGVSNKMIDDFVDEILKNDEINIKSLPDSIERVIYASTVRLTLNAIYKWLSYLHGIGFLGHHLELERQSNIEQDAVGLNFAHNTGKLDSECLDIMANELLKNKSINQWWIPDSVEKQIYVNCLKLVFSLLDKVADTLSIRLCGHELSLSFEPLSATTATELAVHAREHQNEKISVDPAYLDMLVQQAVEAGKPSTKFSVWMLLPFYGTFIHGLHTTLYALILGIVDDLLNKTELNILSEHISIKLVRDDTTTLAADMASNKPASTPSPPQPATAVAAPPDNPEYVAVENHQLRLKVQALSAQLENLRAQSSSAPETDARRGMQKGGASEAGGGGSEREQLKILSAELDSAIKRERVASLSAVIGIFAALVWRPVLWGVKSFAYFLIERLPWSFSAS